MLLSTLYNAGARVSEARGIKVADVDFGGAAPWFVFMAQRPQGSNCAYLAYHCVPQIRRWLLIIDPAALGGLPFPAIGGGPLTRSAITDRLKRATKAAALESAPSLIRRVEFHRIPFAITLRPR